MMKRIFFIMILALFSELLLAQGGKTGIRIGYQGGTFLKPFRNLQILSHQFNQAYPDATNPLKIPNLANGLELEAFLGGKGTFELHWGNKHASDKAEFINPSDNKSYYQMLKYRYNTFGFGIALPWGDRTKFGILNDYGMMSVYQRYGEKSGFSSIKWKNFNEYKKHGFSMGVKLYIDLYISDNDASSLILRPYFQWMMAMSQPMEDITTDNFYPSSNVGISILLSLHDK